MKIKLSGLFVFFGLIGCAANPAPSQVLVLGMVHSGHVNSDVYGIETINEIVRTYEPDYILTEIPPDRFDAAMAGFVRDGVVTEARVSRFPEYVDSVFPLTREMDFVIVPCAGWTRGMADDRRAKLELWRTERPDETAEVDAGMAWVDAEIARRGFAEDDPAFIHTDEYDEIVRAGMEPYNRLFNDDLGVGGWDNINAAHWALIEAAIDAHENEGARFLITFGAWHKFWFMDRLRERDDVVLIGFGSLGVSE